MTALNNILKQQIHTEGSLSIAQFMAEALGNPQHGYYQKSNPFGQEGDFITAPEISQVFGELIGIWCAASWQQMGSPDCALIEMGPGRGTLMRDLLRGTRHIPGFHQHIDVHLVENSPYLAAIQKDSVHIYNDVMVSWHEDVLHLPQKPLLFVANELWDALPIYQYIKTDKGWCERRVALDADDNLTFIHVKLDERSSRALTEKYPDAPLQAVVESCPAGLNIIKTIAQHIKTWGGVGLVIDYGYQESPWETTLQAVKSHQYHSVLEDIGEADITAHVDFGALKNAAEQEGVQVHGAISQSRFLQSLGIEERARILLKNADKAQQADILSRIERLVHPDQMGELFKVMALASPTQPVPVGF